ncbi:MAG: ZIP family metal transporter [Candidatus Hydrothermarchaeales archaeon]
MDSMIYIYAMTACLATILGGLLPLYTRIGKIEMRYMLGFASGVMIATAFFEMLPETGSSLMLGLGFFSIYFIEKLVMIHSCPEPECDYHSIGWIAILGIGIESLIDGVAIAVGYTITPALGLAIALAVIAHELPRGFSTTMIMKNAGYGTDKTLLALGIDSFLTPIGAILAVFLLPSAYVLESVIAFAAGTFIYIGASDLLPEAHVKFNIKVVLSVLLGGAIVPLLALLI